MVKIGEKTVVSVTCQDVILQLAEQYCSEGEYLHFGMKENPKKYVLVTDEKIYLIKSKEMADDRHKEDVFSIQYTQMRKEELRMKFEGWFVEMSTNSLREERTSFPCHFGQNPRLPSGRKRNYLRESATRLAGLSGCGNQLLKRNIGGRPHYAGRIREREGQAVGIVNKQPVPPSRDTE